MSSVCGRENLEKFKKLRKKSCLLNKRKTWLNLACDGRRGRKWFFREERETKVSSFILLAKDMAVENLSLNITISGGKILDMCSWFLSLEILPFSQEENTNHSPALKVLFDEDILGKVNQKGGKGTMGCEIPWQEPGSSFLQSKLWNWVTRTSSDHLYFKAGIWVRGCALAFSFSLLVLDFFFFVCCFFVCCCLFFVCVWFCSSLSRGEMSALAALFPSCRSSKIHDYIVAFGKGCIHRAFKWAFSPRWHEDIFALRGE